LIEVIAFVLLVMLVKSVQLAMWATETLPPTGISFVNRKSILNVLPPAAVVPMALLLANHSELVTVLLDLLSATARVTMLVQLVENVNLDTPTGMLVALQLLNVQTASTELAINP